MVKVFYIDYYQYLLFDTADHHVKKWLDIDSWKWEIYLLVYMKIF